MASQYQDALRLSVVLLALLAACGGDRSRAAGANDTTSAAVVTPDSAAMPVGDTAAPGGTATATAPAPATDSGAKQPAAAPAPAKKKMPADTRTAHATADVPPGQADRDTARVKKAEAPKSAAAPAPAPTPAKQDTSAAAAQAGGTELRDAYHQAPHDTVSQAVYNGWKQFNLNCARCHGEDVLGTTIAPHLIVSLKPDGPINTKELFVQTVCAGRPEKGMPAWCALGLEMDKINDIYAYVKGRSDAKISPGRPAVKQGG